MSNQNLPAGAFLTTLNGRRCTAVPRSDAPPVVAATQSAAANSGNDQAESNNAGNTQEQPQATEVASPALNDVGTEQPPAASTTETSSTPVPDPQETIDALAQSQSQAAALQAQQEADQKAAAASQAQAGGGLGAQLGQQAADPVQVQAEETPAAEIVAEEVQATSPTNPPAAPPPPPPPIEAQQSEQAPQVVAPAPAPAPAQNAQQGQENPPIQAFTANENEAESTSLPSQDPIAPAAESSQTDNNIVPTTPSVAVGAGQASAPAVAPTPAVPQSEVTQDSANVANGNLVTTIGLNNAATAAADNSATNVPNAGVVDNNNGGGGSGAPTAVVAGSVIGGLAVVSLIAFLLWFWRKRALRKRRSTLLTPLSVGPAFGRGNNYEKSYMIDRNSLGPTPKSTKFKAAVGANIKKFWSKSGDDGTPAVNMNRGNSQFMDPLPGQHSRNNSALSSRGSSKSEVTGKDRFKDWWSRLTADVSFNWKLRNDRNAEPDPFTAARDMKERKAAMGSQPDFLTLLGMDEREVQREAEQRRQMNHVAKASAGSADHFLGGLNLNFDTANNPFSDSNALHDSAKPAPLVVSQPNNPFSDDNAIRGATKPPTTYVADVRRSRGQSLGGNGGNGNAGPNPNGLFSPGVDSLYRESVQSVESFGVRRNKFRSDPFDLERPELLGRQAVTSSNLSTAGSSVAPRLSSNGSDRASGLPGRPNRAHHRTESFSSKYSSGISLGDWSDPGPDVGPGGRRWDSPTEGWRPGEGPSRRSGGSQRSVGKAL